MATQVKFVSTDFIKKNTVVEMNVDDSKITPIIFKVQRVYLQQILGSSFYDHLSDAVANGTLTAKEESLIRDYIQTLITEYVLYELYPFLNYKSTNKAISKESSEFSTPADLDEIKYLRSNVKDMAEFFAKRLTTYLCDHQEDFPEYQNPDQPENLPKNNRAYFNGIYMPRKGPEGIESYDEPFEE